MDKYGQWHRIRGRITAVIATAFSTILYWPPGDTLHMNIDIQSPIIVIGMHRSGTSLVARLLDKLGVFVGSRLDSNHEAVFFLKLNDWLLRQSGGAWDQPRHVDHLLKHLRLRSLTQQYLVHTLSSPRSSSFLGPYRFARGDRIMHFRAPWGWKDPRNTFTLPLWLDIFPDARVINVQRHGVDVANSLRVRFERRLQLATQRFQKWKLGYRFYSKRRGFAESARCATLEGAFSLWEEYVHRAASHAASLHDRCLTIRFEESVNDPTALINSLTRFCRIQPNAQRLQAAMMTPMSSRAYAFQSDNDLQRFAAAHADRLGDYALALSTQAPRPAHDPNGLLRR